MVIDVALEEFFKFKFVYFKHLTHRSQISDSVEVIICTRNRREFYGSAEVENSVIRLWR